METPTQQTPQMEAPGLGEMLEATLRVPFQSTEIFGQMRESPRPGYGVMVANFLFWNGLGILLNLVSTMVRIPEAAGIGVSPLTYGLGVALLVALPGSFVVAGVLHLMARLSGGRDGYGRSFQILSLMGAIAPLSAVVLWLPSWSWIAPTLYATFLAARAVSLMHYAPVLQAWMIFGTAGILLSAGQLSARAKIARFQRNLETSMNLYANPAASPSPLSRSPDGSGAGQGPAAAGPNPQSPWPPSADEAAGPAGNSGLEMVQQPGAGPSGLPSGVAPGSLPSNQQLQQMQDMSLQMLRQANERVQQPGALDNLPPEQARQIQELMRMANQLGGQFQQSGKIGNNPQQTQQFIQQMMQAVQSVQEGGVQSPRARSKSRSKKRKSRPAPPPEEGP